MVLETTPWRNFEIRMPEADAHAGALRSQRFVSPEVRVMSAYFKTIWDRIYIRRCVTEDTSRINRQINILIRGAVIRGTAGIKTRDGWLLRDHTALLMTAPGEGQAAEKARWADRHLTRRWQAEQLYKPRRSRHLARFQYAP
jgi:hypothetical protein